MVAGKSSESFVRAVREPPLHRTRRGEPLAEPEFCSGRLVFASPSRVGKGIQGLGRFPNFQIAVGTSSLGSIPTRLCRGVRTDALPLPVPGRG